MKSQTTARVKGAPQSDVNSSPGASNEQTTSPNYQKMYQAIAARSIDYSFASIKEFYNV